MSDMTCQEVHKYFRVVLQVNSDLLPDIELSEHISRCPSCHHFFEEQEQLSHDLHLLRDSVPAIPASVDVTVVSNYRGYLSERPHPTALGPKKHPINIGGALGLAAAVMFAIIVAYSGMLLFTPRLDLVGRQGMMHQLTMPPPSNATKKETTRAPIRREDSKSHSHSVKPADDAVSIAEAENSFPTRFRGLMYCDQLSCPGAMEVIRVQLPSPVLGASPASSQTNEVVSAEVLVGPDGIVRGIRVVE
jgi:hypothetical protein